MKQLARQSEKLESELAPQFKNNGDLNASLQNQKAATTSINQKFTDYIRKLALGGELGPLQDAVAGLQAQITEYSRKHSE